MERWEEFEEFEKEVSRGNGEASVNGGAEHKKGRAMSSKEDRGGQNGDVEEEKEGKAVVRGKWKRVVLDGR